jgi:excinuclease UvrABC helicase subunit UvrB
VFDFVHEHARREEDRMFLEKWRPYIVRVNASAAAMQQIEKSAFQRAQTITQEAIDRIEALEGVVDDETFAFERDRSVQALRELLAQIQKNRPLSEVEQLERQLGRAVERQEFERAALLRDKIRDLKKQQVAT